MATRVVGIPNRMRAIIFVASLTLILATLRLGFFENVFRRRRLGLHNNEAEKNYRRGSYWADQHGLDYEDGEPLVDGTTDELDLEARIRPEDLCTSTDCSTLTEYIDHRTPSPSVSPPTAPEPAPTQPSAPVVVPTAPQQAPTPPSSSPQSAPTSGTDSCISDSARVYNECVLLECPDSGSDCSGEAFVGNTCDGIQASCSVITRECCTACGGQLDALLRCVQESGCDFPCAGERGVPEPSAPITPTESPNSSPVSAPTPGTSAPPSDTCEAAVTLPVTEGGFVVSGTTEGATFDDVPCREGVEDPRGVWYRILSSPSSRLTVSTCHAETTGSVVITVYSDPCTDIATSSCVAVERVIEECEATSFGNTVAWDAEPLRPYWIHVFSEGSVNFGISAAASNDLPAPTPPTEAPNAAPVAVPTTPTSSPDAGPVPTAPQQAPSNSPDAASQPTGTIDNTGCDTGFLGPFAPGSTINSGSTIGFPTVTTACDATNTGPSVWALLVGTGNTLIVSTCNEQTEFDTILTVYMSQEGASCNALQCVSAFQGSCETSGRTVTFDSAAGSIYFVVISGAEGTEGNFGIQIEEESS